MDEEELRRLSRREIHILDSEATIRVPKHLARPNPVRLGSDSACSSIGALDDLPVEILYMILNQLDVLALFRLARVSHRGRQVVHSHVEFRDLVDYAYPALVALGMTELLHWHSCQTLRSALLEESCVSCGYYGPFLYLLTCERCCYACLGGNQSLWVIPTAMAKACFGLKARDLRTVPRLHSVPGTYWIRSMHKYKRRFRLVSVKTVKQIAISIHGADAALAGPTPTKPLSVKDEAVGRWLRKAPLEPLTIVPWKQKTQANKPTDMFAGMGCTPFPVLRPGRIVEDGFWCRGCQLFYEKRADVTGHWRSIEHLIPVGIDPARVIAGMARQARSRTQFLEHVKTCVGVRMFLGKVKASGSLDQASEIA